MREDIISSGEKALSASSNSELRAFDVPCFIEVSFLNWSRRFLSIRTVVFTFCKRFAV